MKDKELLEFLNIVNKALEDATNALNKANINLKTISEASLSEEEIRSCLNIVENSGYEMCITDYNYLKNKLNKLLTRSNEQQGNPSKQLLNEAFQQGYAFHAGFSNGKDFEEWFNDISI